MKKFLSVILFAITLLFVSSQAEAREVYVGSYSDGTPVYVISQTVQQRSWSQDGGYWCRVRAGRDYLDYEFWTGGGYSSWKYKNSEGYSGYVYDGNSPIAAKILNYIRR